ncbi:MAG TPA: hypothetical protein VFQ53_23525 [Kofleriaceae bacterium]|nr:hypothetical protein [Kofleriaceae bacterium]
MRSSLLLVAALAACTKEAPHVSPPPRDAAPGPLRVDAAPVADATLPVDAVAVIDPHATPLTGLAMAGPYATRKQLCAAQVCPKTTKIGNDVLAVTKDCPSEPPDSDVGTRMAKPPAPFTDAFLLSINCREDGLRDDSRDYRLAIRRADGYWITPPLFSISGNDKYCSGELHATWTTPDLTPGTDVAVTIAARTDCVSCLKQGSDSSGVDFIVAVADHAKPVYFPPLAIGQHVHQAPEDWAQPDADCPKLDFDAAQKPTWMPDGRLVLTGPAQWRTMHQGDAGLSMTTLDDVTASTAGSYRFVVP